MSSDRSTVSRRSLLATLGTGTAGLAGCLSPLNPPDDSPEGESTPPWKASEPYSFGSPVSANGVVVHPLRAVVQDAVHYRTADGIGIHGGGDRRYLFVRVLVEAHRSVDDVSPGRFRLELAEQELTGWNTPDDVDGEVVHPRYGDPYTGVPEGEWETRRTSGWFGFEVPPGASVRDGQFRLDPSEQHRRDIRWALPVGIERSIRGEAPSLSLTDATATPADGGVEVSVTVENEGTVRGGCAVAAIPAGGDGVGGIVDVTAGGTATGTIPVPATDGVDGSTLRVATALDEERIAVGGRSVEVRPGSPV